MSSLVVGLTGGIGSGKTTVAELFAKKGITVIDADQIAREVTAAGQPALTEITHYFGPEAIQPDGTLNRAYIRKIIFADEKKRLWLEKLLHPLIRTRMQEKVKLSTSPYCLVVIPLLFETAPNPLIDRVLVIDATPLQQIERTQARDNTSFSDIESILKTQIPRTERLRKADDVIQNNGDLDHLATQVNIFHKYYINEALLNKT